MYYKYVGTLIVFVITLTIDYGIVAEHHVRSGQIVIIRAELKPRLLLRLI